MLGTTTYLHHFGNDELGAVCNDAMAPCLIHVDENRSNDYRAEAHRIAYYIGMVEPLDPMPFIFTELSPALSKGCSQGACSNMADGL